jgi:hypothetical protein
MGAVSKTGGLLFLQRMTKLFELQESLGFLDSVGSS